MSASPSPTMPEPAMKNAEHTASDSHVLKLTGELTIYRAADVALELVSALERYHDLDIDLSEVSDLDSAGVQLLLQARREASVRGRKLRLSSHSAAVQEVFERLNLAGHFAVDSTPA